MNFGRRLLIGICGACAAAFVPASAFAGGFLAIGAEKGDPPRVVIRIDPADDQNPEVVAASFFAFDEGFNGGVRVAVGDFDADVDPEVATASGSGMTATVRIWDLAANGTLVGLKETFSTPFSGFSGGIFVAAGDFDANGKDSLVVSNGKGECRIWIFDDTETVGPGDNKLGNSLIDTFLAFPSTFQGGVRIAMGITNPDTREDLVCVNGPGNQTHNARIYRDNDGDSALSDETLLDKFLITKNGPYKGAYVAVGNFSAGTSNGEIAVYCTGGGNTQIRIYTDADNDGIFSDGTVSELFEEVEGLESKGGLRLAAANLDNDAGATARFELVASAKTTQARPEIRISEAAANAGSAIGGATQIVIPYVDSLITTYFKRTPFVDWGD